MNALEKQIYETEAQLQRLQKELDRRKTPNVPFWGIFTRNDNSVDIYRIVGECTPDHYDYDKENSNYIAAASGQITKSFFDRLATPQEIKAHLIKLAKEKYKEGDTVARLTQYGFENNVNLDRLEYYCRYDELICSDNTERFYLYKQGKWAEKVPSLPSWDDLIGDQDVVLRNCDKLKNAFTHVNKLGTLSKLMAVADYVNEGSDNCNNVIMYNIVRGLHIDVYTVLRFSPVYFKSCEAAEKAIDIFRHNGSEQELIDFFK